MAKSQTNGKIIKYPFAALMQGARVDGYREELQAGQPSLVLEVQGFELESSELFEREGVLHERVRGKYLPLQLRFLEVENIRQNGFFTNLASIPAKDPARTIRDMLSWVQLGKPEPFILFYMNSPVSGSLRFYAGSVKSKKLAGEPVPVSFDRDWSPPPPMATREVPNPQELYEQFAGDPVTIHLAGRARTKQLFVGGVETQNRQRPNVDAVLNLGEEPSIWAKGGTDPNDRWVHKGEARMG